MTLDAVSPKNEGCCRYLIDSHIHGGVAGGKGGGRVVAALPGNRVRGQQSGQRNE